MILKPHEVARNPRTGILDLASYVPNVGADPIARIHNAGTNPHVTPHPIDMAALFKPLPMDVNVHNQIVHGVGKRYFEF